MFDWILRQLLSCSILKCFFSHTPGWGCKPRAGFMVKKKGKKERERERCPLFPKTAQFTLNSKKFCLPLAFLVLCKDLAAVNKLDDFKEKSWLYFRGLKSSSTHSWRRLTLQETACQMSDCETRLYSGLYTI